MDLMIKDTLEELEMRLSRAEESAKELVGGRVYDVGVQVLYNGKLGIVVDLNKDSTDPAGSTVDIRMADGTKTYSKVPVNSKSLKRYRA